MQIGDIHSPHTHCVVDGTQTKGLLFCSYSKSETYPANDHSLTVQHFCAHTETREMCFLSDHSI